MLEESEIFLGRWEAVKGFTGDVFDYLKNPGEIVKIALDKFVGLGDFFEPWLSIAGGIVNLTFDGIVSFVSGIFDKIVPKVDYVPGAGVEQWRDLAKHALQMTGQYTKRTWICYSCKWEQSPAEIQTRLTIGILTHRTEHRQKD